MTKRILNREERHFIQSMVALMRDRPSTTNEALVEKFFKRFEPWPKQDSEYLRRRRAVMRYLQQFRTGEWNFADHTMEAAARQAKAAAEAKLKTMKRTKTDECTITYKELRHLADAAGNYLIERTAAKMGAED